MALYGTSGNDTLYGGQGNDVLYGENGNDSLLGENGNDSLYGHEGNDTLIGGQGNDSLNGWSGDDSLAGGEGNDIFNGKEGNDILDGGQGSDRFVYSTDWTPFNSVNFGVDVISDFVTGSDKIVLNKSTFTSINSTVGTGFSLAGEFALVTSDADASTSTADIVYNSVNGNLFYNPNGSDPGFGTGALLLTLTGAPSLVATDFMIEAAALSLSGGAGNDTLIGGEGNDSLSGMDGDDSLIGGIGDNYLSGGAGNDTLIGGQGSDSFIFDTGWGSFSSIYFGVDVISDFVSGTDKLVLGKGTFNSISSTIGTGFSVVEEFATVTIDADAATSTADIVYNSVNGNLFYNDNGSDPGFGTGTLLATLAGAPTLVATDFILVPPPYFGE